MPKTSIQLAYKNPISMQKIPWGGFGPAYEEVEIMIKNNIN